MAVDEANLSLLEAAQRGNRSACLTMLRAGLLIGDANAMTEDEIMVFRTVRRVVLLPGATVLHLAMAQGWGDVCRLLIRLPRFTAREALVRTFKHMFIPLGRLTALALGEKVHGAEWVRMTFDEADISLLTSAAHAAELPPLELHRAPRPCPRRRERLLARQTELEAQTRARLRAARAARREERRALRAQLHELEARAEAAEAEARRSQEALRKQLDEAETRAEQAELRARDLQQATAAQLEEARGGSEALQARLHEAEERAEEAEAAAKAMMLRFDPFGDAEGGESEDSVFPEASMTLLEAAESANQEAFLEMLRAGHPLSGADATTDGEWSHFVDGFGFLELGPGATALHLAAALAWGEACRLLLRLPEFHGRGAAPVATSFRRGLQSEALGLFGAEALAERLRGADWARAAFSEGSPSLLAAAVLGDEEACLEMLPLDAGGAPIDAGAALGDRSSMAIPGVGLLELQPGATTLHLCVARGWREVCCRLVRRAGAEALGAEAEASVDHEALGHLTAEALAVEVRGARWARDAFAQGSNSSFGGAGSSADHFRAAPLGAAAGPRAG